jgi:hypothetical protein
MIYFNVTLLIPVNPNKRFSSEEQQPSSGFARAHNLFLAKDQS